MRIITRWAFSTWWMLSLFGWVGVSQAGLEYSAHTVARGIVGAMPLWGLPWYGPLALIRSMNAPGGTRTTSSSHSAWGCSHAC